MGRLIDIDRLCNDLMERWSTADKKKEDLIRAVMADVVTPIVVSQPTVDAVTVKHGRWITHEVQINGYAYAIYECTVCGASRPTIFFPLAYCPNCGARMDGKDGDQA